MFLKTLIILFHALFCLFSWASVMWEYILFYSFVFSFFFTGRCLYFFILVIGGAIRDSNNGNKEEICQNLLVKLNFPRNYLWNRFYSMYLSRILWTPPSLFAIQSLCLWSRWKMMPFFGGKKVKRDKSNLWQYVETNFQSFSLYFIFSSFIYIHL